MNLVDFARMGRDVWLSGDPSPEGGSMSSKQVWPDFVRWCERNGLVRTNTSILGWCVLFNHYMVNVGDDNDSGLDSGL